MRLLIFGGYGMLGHKLVQVLSKQFEVYFTIRQDYASFAEYGIFSHERTIEKVDVSNHDSVIRVIEHAEPDIVINAVGIVKQLPSAKDVIRTLTVNSIFPQKLAELSKSSGFRFITISTDCVFSGTKGSYSEDDPADALDLYGQSKHFGEIKTEGNSLTLRTSIIGRELATSHGLIEWFLANRGNQVNGYVNAIYSGFPTLVLADIISNLIVEHSELKGLYHISSEPIGKYELLTLIKDRLKFDIQIEPYNDFHIDRSLDSTRFRGVTGYQPPSWPDMVDRMCSDPTPYDKWRK